MYDVYYDDINYQYIDNNRLVKLLKTLKGTRTNWI